MTTSADPPAAGVAVITVVQAPACHFCVDAADALAELGREFPIRVEAVEAGEPRGAALVRQYRAPMFPLVLVNGGYFSSGRLPRRKLAAVLAAARTATGVA